LSKWWHKCCKRDRHTYKPKKKYSNPRREKIVEKITTRAKNINATYVPASKKVMRHVSLGRYSLKREPEAIN
jgi:hypothetical protein